MGQIFVAFSEYLKLTTNYVPIHRFVCLFSVRAVSSSYIFTFYTDATFYPLVDKLVKARTSQSLGKATSVRCQVKCIVWVAGMLEAWGAGGALAPSSPGFGRLFDPILTRESRLCPPDIQNF